MSKKRKTKTINGLNVDLEQMLGRTASLLTGLAVGHLANDAIRSKVLKGDDFQRDKILTVAGLSLVGLGIVSTGLSMNTKYGNTLSDFGLGVMTAGAGTLVREEIVAPISEKLEITPSIGHFHHRGIRIVDKVALPTRSVNGLNLGVATDRIHGTGSHGDFSYGGADAYQNLANASDGIAGMNDFDTGEVY